MKEKKIYKNLSIIVAVAENMAIGKDNQLLWHISEDLKRFKRITTGKTVVMGKKTYESLPIHPLPNRTNIVISNDVNDNFDGCVMVNSIEEAIENCDKEGENFIMGGGSIYRQFLKISGKLYLTKVHAIFGADTFFPDVLTEDWELIEHEHHCRSEKNDLPYSFLTYLKR